MKKIILGMLLSVLCFISFNLESNAEENQRILLICSYNAEFITYSEQIEGIRSVMDYNQYEIDVEFMDAKRFNSEENTLLFYQSLEYKLDHSEKYDLVLLADDYALSFAMDYREELFQDIPMIFFGINDVENAFVAYESGYFTGVVESVSMYETILIASVQNKDANKVIAVVDGTKSGQGDLELFYSFQDIFPDLIFDEVSLKKIEFIEFPVQLNLINENDIVLLLSAYQDKNDETIDFYESLKMINMSCKAPIYHLWHHGIGEGVLGGKVISHYEQGKKAAEISLKILEGRLVSSVCIVNESPNQYIFDYNILEIKGIDLDTLPKDSIVINKPENTFDKIRNILLGVIISLVVIILILFYIYQIRNISQKKIKKENLQLGAEIKERMESEKLALKAREEAEVTNEAKSRFLANMSHEIRTPMNGILGLTDLTLCSDLTAEQRDNLLLIRQSSTSLLSIITDIIDYTKIEAGELYLEKKDFEIRAILNEIIHLFSINIKEKDLFLRINIAEEVPQYLIGDAVKIIQVLSNLVGNAIKFTFKGGIDVNVDILSVKDNRINLQFEIIDTGIGLDEKLKDRIFMRFYQYDMSCKKRHQGSGLGLSITKGIVDAMNGQIRYESKGNSGTTFFVTLPFETSDRN